MESAWTSLACATLPHFPQACVQFLANIFKAWSSSCRLELGTLESCTLSMSAKHRIKGRGRREHCLPTLSLTSRLRLRRLLSRWRGLCRRRLLHKQRRRQRRRWREHADKRCDANSGVLPSRFDCNRQNMEWQVLGSLEDKGSIQVQRSMEKTLSRQRQRKDGAKTK